MALKNLFDMAKADRYTADGREALIKAQEAETEDKVYQIGEISQKTGLQKTANGWVKPKSGKQPGAASKHDTDPQTYIVKKNDELRAMFQKEKDPAKKAAMKKALQKQASMMESEPFSPREEPGPDRDDSPERAAYERELSRQQAQRAADDPRGFGYEEPPMEPAAEKPERFDYRSSLEKNPRDAFSFKGTVNHSIPINQYHYDELQNLASFMREEKATYQNALKNRAQALVDGHKANGDWEPKKEQALMDIAKAVGFDEELHKFIAEENRGYDLGYSEDSAPSLSEIVDRVYNIGEISEKTGLQKTAQGWKPPKETKFGKVKQNKEGQWGVQTKQGKGSDFLKHKSEKEASRALANYTAGYNTTERSKQDPHSDYARQQKQWNKEVDRMRKNSNAERRAEHASHFQENKPDAADRRDQIGGEIKGNLEAAKYYFDKAQSFSPTDPSYKTYMLKAKQYNDEAKAQADDNGFDFEEMHNSGVTQAVNKYAEEQSKPAAQEVKLGGGADTYYFEDPDSMSNEDKVFKSLGIELAETFGDHDGEPGNTETWANGWLDNIMDNGGLGIKSKKTRQPAAPVPADEVMRIVEENPARWDRIIGNAKKFYEGKGRSTDFESDEFYPIKLVGGKTKPSAQYYAEGKRNEKNNPLTGKYVTQRQNTSKDAAPRVLTGDCRIRIRKEKPALTGDTKIRVRK